MLVNSGGQPLTAVSKINRLRSVPPTRNGFKNAYTKLTCQCPIEISISDCGAKNIVGFIVPSSLPRYDIPTTARCILQERIAAKAETCRALKFDHSIWLALRNGYPLADVETYRVGMNMFSVNHPFEKILLISRDGSVDELWAKPEAT